MKKQWKRLAALSSAAVMAAGTLLYFPTDTLQNISWGITASAEETGAGTESGSLTWTEDNLTWTLTADGTMTISGTGAMKDHDTDDSPATKKKDSVKEVVIQEGVTSIGAYSFFDCRKLASIEIPSSVTSIGIGAFSWCTGLNSITIPSSVTSIGNSAFISCTGLTSITIPDSVTSIGDCAFERCSNLASITIPKSVTSIGDSAFESCTGLTSIEIPSNVESIGNYAFYNCTGLTNITIPKSVESVGDRAFYGCDNLTEVLLENGSKLTSDDLGVDASKIRTYWNEGDLTWTLTADGTMTISGSGAMKGYSWYSGSPAAQKKDNVKKVVIEDGVTSIGMSAFNDCDSLTSITIPESVTSIRAYAFESCGKLASITIPKSVTSIGTYAFSGTPWLTNKQQENDSLVIVNGILIDGTACSGKVTIPDGVTSIGEGAFYNCSSLTSIEIPEGVTSIGDYAFGYCSSLASIEIPSSVTSIGNYAFRDCSSLASIEIPSSVTSIGDSAFDSCTGLTSITIPKSVTSIGSVVFYQCNKLTVYLEEGSTLTSGQLGVDENKISSYQSWTEDNLTWTLTADGTMTISGTGTMMDYDIVDSPAAQKKDSVKKVVIEDGVTSIGNGAFKYCSSLTDITIPGSVTSIGTYAFSGCTALTEVLLENGSTLTSENFGEVADKVVIRWNEGNLTWTLDAEGTMAISGTGAMKNYGTNNSPAAQKKASVKKVVIEDGITSIGDYAFFDCSSLTSIEIPEGVTSIGEGAFSNCRNLASIEIPESVTSIGDFAFFGCGDSLEITVSCDSTLKKDAFGDASEKVKYRHSLVKTDAKDATYTEAGNVEYWTCENCKKHFLSDETDVETAKAVEQSATVKPVLVQVATATTQIKCVYGQDMDEINLQDYVKNADAVGGVSVKVATGSTMLDGMQLDSSKLSGKPAKTYTDGKDVTFTFTAKNGNTANLTLNFLVAKADPTVKVAVDGDTHTEGDLVSELKLILSGNNTKGLAEIISEIKALAAGENTLTWKFTPEDSENYNVVTGTVVVNAQTTTTTNETTSTTKETTATTKATTATSGTTSATKATTATSGTTSATKATTATSGTTSATKATTVTSGTTATTKATATTNETTATIEETTTTNETTATTEETTTNETTVTTEETTITNETTVTTEASTVTTRETSATTEESTITTNETTATTEETTTTNETTATTEATTVTTNETTATTKATTATNGTTATSGTTSASETTMTTSASNTESTAATSATTITTAATTSVTNIADEDLCSWAINDYQKKAGIVPANAEITARSEETCEITLTDENGNVLDVYTVDPKTGVGTDSSNAEVNLPQTGNNAMTNWLLCVGAALFMAFGFGAVKASGVLKRKEDE